MSIQPVTPTPAKKGYKTSEFWLTAFGTLGGLLNQSGAIGTPLPIDALMTLAAMISSYVLSRGVAKKV